MAQTRLPLLKLSTSVLIATQASALPAALDEGHRARSGRTSRERAHTAQREDERGECEPGESDYKQKHEVTRQAPSAGAGDGGPLVHFASISCPSNEGCADQRRRPACDRWAAPLRCTQSHLPNVSAGVDRAVNHSTSWADLRRTHVLLASAR